MDSLFAPWRMQWVTRDRPNDGSGSECPFCVLPDRDDDRDSNIVVRSEHVYVVLNNMPYNPGHVMTIPYAHEGSFQMLDEQVLLDCLQVTQLAITALDASLSPDGFNVGFNIGSAGGASITDHLHLHVIPRWTSDTSFMPLTANTAVVEEAVDETYQRLRRTLLDLDGTRAPMDGGAVELGDE